MELTSQHLREGQRIPSEFAFAIADPIHHVALSDNRNPDLAWHGAPAGTRSFALLCCDPDVPSRGDDVNQEGRSVPASLPRVDFFHWVLIDLPAGLTSIQAGEFANGVIARGKPGPTAAHGSRQGINDYTGWFAGDNDMRGDYYGYDGPCPPWNDELRHRYVFTVFALDIDNLPLTGRFTGQEVRAALAGHILDQASLTVTYSLNPAVSA